MIFEPELYLVENLHQTTTDDAETGNRGRCILLKIYIKPQPRNRSYPSCMRCILLKIYIKPQLFERKKSRNSCCILLKIYIKPQLSRWLLR